MDIPSPAKLCALHFHLEHVQVRRARGRSAAADVAADEADTQFRGRFGVAADEGLIVEYTSNVYEAEYKSERHRRSNYCLHSSRGPLMVPLSPRDELQAPTAGTSPARARPKSLP
jgi:hypothetical protein